MNNKSSKQKINELKAYFQKRDDALIAFLFGSRSKDKAMTESDWDIACYFKPAGNVIEYQIDRDFTQESEVWGDLIKILGTDSVDLIVLNRVPATVADAAIKGQPLVIKDRKLFIEFMLRVTSEAIDFRQTAHEYAEIFWRPKSLIKEDAYSLERRLVFLDAEIVSLEEFLAFTAEDYEKKDDKRRQLERTIENIMNAAIDICKIILASQKNSVPSTYREVIYKTGFVGGFSQEIMKDISQWAELRNILAHEYLDIRWKRIEDFLKRSQSRFDEFMNSAKDFLRGNSKGTGL